jgi:hypothetical protein
VEDTRRDRKACIEAKRDAIVGHLSDGATTRIPKVPFGGMYPSIHLLPRFSPSHRFSIGLLESFMIHVERGLDVRAAC